MAAALVTLAYSRLSWPTDPRPLRRRRADQGAVTLEHPGARKRSQNGQWNVRYKTLRKGHWVDRFRALVAEHLPSCRVRYAF